MNPFVRAQQQRQNNQQRQGNHPPATRPGTNPGGRPGHAQQTQYPTHSNYFNPNNPQTIHRPQPVRGNTHGFQRYSSTHDFQNIYGSNARRGYHGYGGGLGDSFFFGFYVMDPYSTVGYYSPWYYYPYLPGYVAPSSVYFDSSGLIMGSFSGMPYLYPTHNVVPEPGTNSILNAGIHDIANVFRHKDWNALDRVVPQSGNVNIYMDGQYEYSMSADKFYDMMKDNADQSQTVRYHILDVRIDRQGYVRLVAQHIFTDPWNNQQTVYHTYTLAVNGQSVQVVEFGTSQSPP